MEIKFFSFTPFPLKSQSTQNGREFWTSMFRLGFCLFIFFSSQSILSYSEELSRLQAEVQRLQGSLAAARDDCVGVSEERLHLQQENLQLRREMDELRKTTMLAQKKAKQQVNERKAESVSEGIGAVYKNSQKKKNFK